MADKKTQRFTFDSEKDGAEVPTLTSLLYKKNVVKTKPSPGQLRHEQGGKNASELRSTITNLDPTVTLDTTSIGMARPAITEPAQPSQRSEISVPTPTSTPEVVAMRTSSPTKAVAPHPNQVAEKRIIPAKVPYQPALMIRSTRVENYPENGVAAPGIQYLFGQAKVGAALIFQSKDSDTLTSSLIVGNENDRKSLWNKMEFAKSDFADLWGRLEKYSFAEYSTLGVAGQGNVDRMAFRAAFQVRGSEWLTLIRVRQPSGGDALLAVISEASLQAHIPNFHTACMGKGALTKAA